ncbi:hypothetical protein EIP91_012304 [Steccherinum ochraceum]|uniref:O-methyltransferase domain-containing protein n=1 Tax=Steccherinum ochraceum TaxID=92696 RepID=A0A4R0RQ61_9APHY|nr:hypothetical protein EIP91_012304 [Steccherinum ochraceum]
MQNTPAPKTSVRTEGTTRGYVPHTPHDRVSHLLSQALSELESKHKPNDGQDLHVAMKILDEARHVIDGYDTYVAAHSSPHPDIVGRMLEAGDHRDWERVYREGRTQFRLIPEMSAGGYEGVVLQQLAKISKAKNILEIGMFTGTTTVSLALVPTVRKVTTLDIEPYLKDINVPYFVQAGVAHKIDIRIGDAMTSLDTLDQENASFDMIFIDADKPSYTKYFTRIMSSSHLLAQGGLIAVDNVAFKGAPWASAAMYDMGEHIHSFNETVRQRADVEVVILPIEDGISLIRRKEE